MRAQGSVEVDDCRSVRRVPGHRPARDRLIMEGFRTLKPRPRSKLRGICSAGRWSMRGNGKAPEGWSLAVGGSET